MNEVSNQISGTKTIRRGDKLQCSADIIPISEFYVNSLKAEYGGAQICLASVPECVAVTYNYFLLCDSKVVSISNLHIVCISLRHFLHTLYLQC